MLYQASTKKLKIEAADIFANISTLKKKYFLSLFFMFWSGKALKTAEHPGTQTHHIHISVSSAAVIRLLNQITWKKGGKKEILCWFKWGQRVTFNSLPKKQQTIFIKRTMLVIYWSDPDSHTGYLLIAVHTYRCTHKLTDMQSHNIHILTQCIHTERKTLRGHWCVVVLPKERSSTRITGVITHVNMFHPLPPLSTTFPLFSFLHTAEKMNGLFVRQKC